MNNFQVGENVFVLVRDRTAVVECKIVEACNRRARYYSVEPICDVYVSDRDKYAPECDVFRTKAKAWYAVAEKWAAIRDVAEANRERAVDQSIL